ncbi:MAG: hypothetical protein F4Z34_03870 [Acidimicrobiaceae bacterium]|nr:hypothetical protein [Acidimicrobiaceae bacterium]
MSDEQLRADELVSAYLDGEATPAEIAEVEQDDVLMARVEQLRSVRDAVAAPVAPMPAELRDQMIGAALAAADAETAQRREARIVPIHRRRETLLAVAAAAVLLAAVVSAGLIASRGGDESADMAAAPTESAEAAAAPTEVAAADAAEPAEEAAMAEEEPMAEAAPAPTSTAAFVEMPEEEPMAELEAAMGAAETADDAAIAELEAELEAASAAAEAAAAEAESAMEAPAEETADTPTASAEEERRTADEATGPVVDLGAFENLESLFDNVAARWSAALEDGATADSGMCSAAVQNKVLELDVETGQPFVATVGAEDPLIFDARFARRADGTAIIIYAAPPSCETGTYEQDQSDGS